MSKIRSRVAVCISLALLSFSQVVAGERTFTPRKDYKGDMFAVVRVGGNIGYEECTEIKIIWGPWETKTVSAIRSARSLRPLPIRFSKNKKGEVPLTVITNCSASIDLMYGKPDSRTYEIATPQWTRRK